MTDRISRRFCEIVGENKVLEQEPMARHTTFRIGGPADYFVELESVVSRTPAWTVTVSPWISVF